MKKNAQRGGPVSKIVMAALVLASTAGFVSGLTRTSSDGGESSGWSFVSEMFAHALPGQLISAFVDSDSPPPRPTSTASNFSPPRSPDRSAGPATVEPVKNSTTMAATTAAPGETSFGIDANGTQTFGPNGPESPVSVSPLLLTSNGTLSPSTPSTPSVPNAPNATKFWDSTAGAGNGVGGSATWTTQADTRWSNTATGDAALSAAAVTDAGVFQGTAGTVTIAGDLTLASWTFNTTNYVLTPSSATARTLTGLFSLAAGINLNIGLATKTTDSTFSLVGTGITGGASSGITLQGAQTAAGSDVRILLSLASSSIDVPIAFGGAGTTASGVVANATGTGITGTITNNSAFTTLLGATAGNDLTLSSAAVISGTAGLRIGVKDNSNNVGTVTINSANTYGGGTTFDGGTLVLGNDSALSTGTLTLTNATTSVLQAGTSARTLANNILWGGNGTISGGFAFTLNGTFTSSGANTRTLTVTNTGGVLIGGNVFLSDSDVSARSLTISGTSAVTINGVITNNAVGNSLASSLGYNGNSTLTLTNTNSYTGNTFVNGGGTISVSTIGNAGANGGVGAGTTINLGQNIPSITGTNSTTTGTLLYTGTGETTTKVINLGGTTGGGVIDQSGSGLLKFTSNFTSSGAGSKTLTLQGSTSGTGEIAGIIVNNSATNTTAVVKTGTGTWLLSGANTYTGGTTINQGVLTAGVGSLVSVGGGITVNSGGTLMLSGTGRHIGNAVPITLNGGTFNTAGLSEPGTVGQNIGALTLQSSSTINLGSGASILNFAASNTQTWSGILSILNWTGTIVTGGGTDQLIFGSDVTSLTAAQLLEIQFVDPAGLAAGTYGAIFATSNNGEVVPGAPVPEPSTWIGGALALGAVAWTQRRKLRSYWLSVIG